jgi:hypothetical protein
MADFGGYEAGAAGAAGAQSGLQDLIAARLMRDKLAEAIRAQQVQEGQGQQALDLRKADSAQQNTQFGQRLGLDRDQMAQSGQQFEKKFGEDKRQFDTGQGFKREESARDQGNFEKKLQTDLEQFHEGMGLKRAQFGEERRHNIADEGLKGQQIDAVLQGKTNKPATPAERQSLSYFNRAQDAVKTIADPGAKGVSLEDQVAKSGVMTQAGLQYLPNMLQTSMQQSYRQAQRAFTEARLRKESGAAIPPAEFENDAKTYFAQPGDTPTTIDQKRKARETLLKGMQFASGKAYGEFYGADEGRAAPADKATPGSDPLGIR